MSTPERNSRPNGFALPVAVFALVIVGVLVTSGFYMAHQESRIGRASAHATQAFYLAEAALSEVMESWDVQAYRNLPLNTATSASSGSTASETWDVWVTRLDDYLYFVDSEVTLTPGGQPGATRHVGQTVRLMVADISPPAALTTRGVVELKGQAEIRGVDAIPDGWGAICDAPGEDKPGVLTDDIANVPDSTQITGTPKVQVDSTIDDSTFRNFGDLNWDDLVQMATLTFGTGGSININTTGPRVVDGRCDYSHELNWGDPENPDEPCGSYFPVIHIDGSARLQSGGRGQGILLVDGNLDLRGDFLFHGIILVQGTFETQGAGNRVLGGVMASNAAIEQTQLVGASVVENSNCAVEQAVLNNASLTRPRPLDRRSWVDLTVLTP